jgi:hypothetical protein
MNNPELEKEYELFATLSDDAPVKAAEGRRTPGRFGPRKPHKFAPAFWTAPALWRFSPAYQSAFTSNSSATEIRSVLNR